MTEYVRQRNHNTYGGEVTLEDFNTSLPSKQRITNQANAQNYNTELLDKKRKEEERDTYMRYTLEELKEMKLVSNTSGRPTYGMTDEKWQKEFELRKMFIKPHHPDITKLRHKYSVEYPLRSEQSIENYQGKTQWQAYCIFINDILDNIRAGQVDYCYYIYQVMELARFHIGTLRTQYCKGNGCGYWAVWLDRGGAYYGYHQKY